MREGLERMAAWTRLHGRRAAAAGVAALGVLAVILCLVQGAGLIRQARMVDADTGTVLPADELPSRGYAREGDFFENLAGENASISLAGIDAHVGTLRLSFATPLEEGLRVVVVVNAQREEGREPYGLAREGRAQQDSIAFPIGETVQSVQVRIGEAGQTFRLASISLSPGMAAETYRAQAMRQGLHALLALALAATLVCVLLRASAQRLCAVAVALFGLCYALGTTPYSVPDEPHHYGASYALSSRILGREGDPVPAADFDTGGAFVRHENVSSGYVRIVDALLGDVERAEGTLERIPLSYSVGYPVHYLSQAIGIMLARLLGLGMLGIFYAGRLANLLFYGVCLYFAVRRAGPMKALFVLVGLLPMSLHQAASLSYDAFANGLSLLLLAHVFSAVYEERRVGLGKGLLLAAVCVLLAPTRIIYLPFCVLPFLIPPRRFAARWQYVLCGTLAVLGGVLLVYRFHFGAIRHYAVEGGGGGSAPVWEGVGYFSWEYLLQHPIESAKVFAQTIVIEGKIYVLGALGKWFGGFSLPTPTLAIGAMGLLLVVSALPVKGAGWIPRWFQRAGYLIVAVGVIGMALLSMFVSYTPLTSPVILGVQGRYFIPILPLVFLCLRTRFLQLPRSVDGWLYAGLCSVQAAVLLSAIAQTAARV